MLYELSVPFYPGMPRYDDTIPDIVFVPRTRAASGDVNNTTTVELFLHAGSHVDAPFHFDKNGRTIDQIPIENFIYKKALLLNLPKGRGERITRSDLEGRPLLEEADMILFYTGYSQYVNDEASYRDDFPALDESAARYLRRNFKNLKAIGIDTLSIEGTDGGEKGFGVHHELLDEEGREERSLLVYENMDFRPILHCSSYFQAYAFPLRFKGLDASPVSLIAECFP